MIVYAKGISDIYMLSCLLSKSIIHLETGKYANDNWSVMASGVNDNPLLTRITVHNVQSMSTKRKLQRYNLSYLHAITTEENRIFFHLHDNLITLNVQDFHCQVCLSETMFESCDTAKQT